MKIVIADDEPLARERLRALLQRYPDAEVVAEVGDGQAALQACAAHAPDLLLLDISMPGGDGIAIARELAAASPAPLVVFCTAHDQHALSAFEAAAVDYLLKPIRAERLDVAIRRARALTDSRRDATAGDSAGASRRTHFCARLRGSLRLIPVPDVVYLQAEEKYVVVRHLQGEDLIEESLKSIEDEFGDVFLRIHRNCLVARARLAELRRGPDGQVQAILHDGDRPLDVSRRCVAPLREALLRP